MKVLSLFSGIGAFEKALDNLHIPYELVGFSEIDKYAVKSYCAIHGVDESMNFGDITKIDGERLPKDIDLLTYGFPCQDISIAGKQKGLIDEDGTKTRSGLFFEALRIIEETKPKVAIAENVKNLVGKKFNAQFQVVLASLEAAGYNNYYAVLNAKNFGVPQNRERVFIVSIRKDIDRGLFQFPVPIALNKRLKDILENVVDEKYYLNGECLAGILNALTDRSPYIEEPQVLRQVRTEYGKEIRKSYESGETQEKWGNMRRFELRTDGFANTLSTVLKDNYVAAAMRGRYNQEGKVEQRIEVSDRECANAITTVQKDSLVMVAYDEQNGYIRKDGCVGTIMTDGSSPKKNNRIIETSDPLVWDGYNQRIRVDSTTVGTLTQNCGADLKRNGQGIIESALRIRKLTPKECFRLMGFDDEAFEKAKWYTKEESAELLKRFPKHKGKRQFAEEERIEKMSDSQLYKQAGNSIVVDVLEAIFRQMLDEQGNFTI